MKLIILGTTKFAAKCAEAILDSDDTLSAIISMPTELAPDNSTDLLGYALRRKVPYHEIADINSEESHRIIASYSPDYIVSAWPKILKSEILKIPNYYCIGTHPTSLPFNRGRHPLHWLIVLGIRKSHLSFFKMDRNIDNGNILLQLPYTVGLNASIEDLMETVNKAASKGLASLLSYLRDNPEYLGIPQNTAQANYWRRRTAHDVTIDPRMSTAAIIRLVHSYSSPYPCANLLIEDTCIKITEAHVHDATLKTSSDIQLMEPGKILLITDELIRLKVDDGVVNLIPLSSVPPTAQSIEYICPPSEYIRRYPNLIL